MEMCNWIALPLPLPSFLAAFSISTKCCLIYIFTLLIQCYLLMLKECFRLLLILVCLNISYLI
jgi:hypothetical protein